MFHILLVSEDRPLLNRLYPMIEDDSRFCIHVVPFSMDAVDRFTLHHADVVILDTSVFIPYESILEQLSECQWDYATVLLTSGRDTAIPKGAEVSVIQKDSLCKEDFDSLFARIFTKDGTVEKETDVIVDWNGTHQISLGEDAYHLVYIKSFEKTAKGSGQEFERSICSYANAVEVFHCGNEYFYILARQQLKSDFNFARMAQSAFSVFGQHTSFLYMSSVNQKNVMSQCLRMKALERFSYFYSGQCHNIQGQQERVWNIDEKILHGQCLQLLSALLSGDGEGIIQITRELYLKTIKTAQNFETVEYIRVQINFMNFLFGYKPMVFECQSLEDELEMVLGSPLFVQRIGFGTSAGESSAEGENHGSGVQKVQDIMKQCVIIVYNSYQMNISLEGIARMLNRNKIYLNRIYKELFDMTILDTLQYLRLEHAKFYLTNSQKRVSEISELTGFNDIGYFSKFFHHETGITALDYRARTRCEA